jgi:hypothetical protein
VSAAVRVLLFGQLAFFLGLAACALVAPEGLHDNHGWSYWEGRWATVVPYVLAVLLFVALTLYAAALLERASAPRGLVRGLRWLTVFLLLDVGTPDTVNAVFYWAHDLTSAVLFLYELAFGIWLVRALLPTRLGLSLVGAQFLGGLIAMFSQLQVVSQLGPGIFVFQVSFALLLVTATAAVAEPAPDAAWSAEATAPAVTR